MEAQINIPIYRALKLGTKDEYVEGQPIQFCGNTYLITRIDDIRLSDSSLHTRFTEIDPSTLAIHIDGMIDSEGTKIFASLSEDGEGGDKLHKIGVGFYKEIDEVGVAIIKNGNCYIKYNKDKELLSLQVFHNAQKAISILKVTGIQE